MKYKFLVGIRAWEGFELASWKKGRHALRLGARVVVNTLKWLIHILLKLLSIEGSCLECLDDLAFFDLLIGTHDNQKVRYKIFRS